MFFDPDDYLERDPSTAKGKVEAARLVREAEQRAKLCEETTRMAAEVGFEATKIYLAAPRAGLGLGTYYKLYESKEACLVEAFEKCAETIFRQVDLPV